MTKVYIPVIYYDYEGGRLLGVFSTKKKAEKQLNKDAFKSKGDSNGIVELKLDHIEDDYWKCICI